MIRQSTDISIYFPTHQLTPRLPATYVYPSLRIFFPPHKSTTPHGLLSKDSKVLFFQFSLLSVLRFVFCPPGSTSIRPPLSVS